MGGNGDTFKELRQNKYFDDSTRWNYWHKVDFSDEKIVKELENLEKILDEVMKVIDNFVV